MTLNCLNCQALQRTNSSDSEKDYIKKDKAEAYRKLRYVNVNNVNVNNIERSWSGNLTPPPFEQIHHSSSSSAMFMPEKKKKKSKGPGHRRLMTTGGVAYEGSAEPRLLRSSGMRRDWSFENLSLLRNNTNGRK